MNTQIQQEDDLLISWESLIREPLALQAIKLGSKEEWPAWVLKNG